MRPVFIVKLINGLTDNIFEYDMKNGHFIGQAGEYKYDDIHSFIGFPVEIMRELCEVKQKSKKQEDSAEIVE